LDFNYTDEKILISSASYKFITSGISVLKKFCVVRNNKPPWKKKGAFGYVNYKLKIIILWFHYSNSARLPFHMSFSLSDITKDKKSKVLDEIAFAKLICV